MAAAAQRPPEPTAASLSLPLPLPRALRPSQYVMTVRIDSPARISSNASLILSSGST
jgi:hypothetical protein